MSQKKKFTYEEALEASLEYFQGDDLAAKVFVDKYALRDSDGNFFEKTPKDMHQRLAQEFARIEKKYPNPLSEEDIFDLLDGFKWVVPQGSPTSAIGNPFQLQSLGNCYVLEPPYDSYGGILKADQELAQLMKRRAGVGLSLDNLRPKGAITQNAAKTTDGIGVFMERFSNTCREVAQCIAEGERVLTDAGLKAIEDVIPNEDKVWTKKGWVTVKDVISNGKKQIWKTSSRNGFSIKTSPDHIVLTEQDGDIKEVRIKDLTVGDAIVTIPGSHNRNEKEVELIKNDYIKRGLNQSVRRHQGLTFPKTLNKELAYFLGYSYGDGFVEKNRFNEPWLLSLACGHDWPKIEEKLSKVVYKNFSYKIKSNTGDGAVNKVTIHSKEICSFLEDNGFLKKKAHEISVPAAIFKSPAHVQMAFLAGFFDADGYNSGKKKGYVFSTICRSFAEDIQTLLMANGIISKIHVEDRSAKGWQDLNTVSVTGKHAQSRLVELMGVSVKVCSNKFVAKRDNYRTPFKAKTLGFKRSAQNSFIPDQSQFVSAATYLKAAPIFNVDDQLIITDEIVKMEDAGEVDTYDLVLESEHLFWCEGFYVHNSGRRGAEMMMLSVHHPDIETFINIKRDKSKVTGSNVSVKLTDEFMEAVQSDSEYEQRWPVDNEEPVLTKKVSAKKIWDQIIDAAWDNAEPGLFFIDNQVKYTPADIYASVNKDWLSTATNPCFSGDERFLTKTGYVKFRDSVKKGWGQPLTDNRVFYCDDGGLESPDKWQFDFSQKGTTQRPYEGSAFVTRKHSDLLELEFANGQIIKCTPDHHFATTNGMVEAKDLNVEHEILVSVPTPPDHSIVGLLPETTEEICAFLAGLIAGDGTFCKNNVHIDLWGTDRFRMKDIVCNLIDHVYENSNVEIPLTNGWDKRKPSPFYVSERGQDKKLRISSTFLKHLLKEVFSFSADSKFSVPERILNQARTKVGLYYLSGLFYADGSVQTGKGGTSVRLAQSNKDFLRGVQLLCHANGITGSIYLRRKDHVAKIEGVKYKAKDQYEWITTNGTWRVIPSLFDFNHPDKDFKLKALVSESHSVDKLSKTTLVSSREIEGDTVYCIKESSTRSIIVNTITARRCGEIGMGVDSCRLLVVNLFSFVKDPFTSESSFDFTKFFDVVIKAQRLMDDIVDLELEAMDRIIKKIKKDPEPNDVKKIELDLWKRLRKNCTEGRRTGLGITALGDTLAALGVRYGSEKSIKVTEEIYKTLALGAYRSTCVMAKERGSFPLFSADLEKNHPFLERVWNADEETHNLYQKYGRRNIALTTTAPTGSISILTQTTSGIEPVFLPKYTRRKKINPADQSARTDYVDKMGDRWQEFTVYHHHLKTWMKVTGKTDIGDSPYHRSTSNDVDWKAGVKLQAAAQKWICHSISRTANVPKDTPKELIADIYLEAWKLGCKGYTVYRDGCRDGVLVSEPSSNTDESGRPTQIIPSEAPKRPKELLAEIHHATVKGVKWTIMIGMLADKPYELFMGKSDDLGLGKMSEGKLVRVKKGKYQLSSLDNKVIIDDVLKAAGSDEGAWITRMMSMPLRHGVPVEYVADQLSKDGSVVDLNKVLSRLLKKYVKKRQKKTEESCSQCGSHSLVFEEGCYRCLDCSASGCG